MICKTVTEQKHGPTVLNMTGNINRVKNMDSEHIHGVMGRNLLEIGQITEFPVKAYIRGQTADNMKVNGKITICMAKVYTPGKMADNIRVITNMIKSMVQEYIFGQMEEDIRAFGLTENNTAKVNIFYLMVTYKQVFGKMDKE